MTNTEHETRERFAGRYRVAPAEVFRRIELAVIGGDWGANGYTTMAQADTLARELGLRPGVRLLDLGAGRGWPGLYLAAGTGCQVVLADVPIEGLRSMRYSHRLFRRALLVELILRGSVVDAVCLRPGLNASPINYIDLQSEGLGSMRSPYQGVWSRMWLLLLLRGSRFNAACLGPRMNGSWIDYIDLQSRRRLSICCLHRLLRTALWLLLLLQGSRFNAG